MTTTQELFAVLGLVTFIAIVVTLVFYGGRIITAIFPKWFAERDKMKKRERANAKLPAGWAYNFDKLIDVHQCRAYRLDGAYMTVGECGFLYFHWKKYDLDCQVSHWHPRNDNFDLSLTGNVIHSATMADFWFPADKEVTEEKVWEYFDFRTNGGDSPTIKFMGKSYWKSREEAGVS